MNFLRYWNISGLFRSNLPRVRSEASTRPCSRSRSRTFRRSKYVIDLRNTIASGEQLNDLRKTLEVSETSKKTRHPCQDAFGWLRFASEPGG